MSFFSKHNSEQLTVSEFCADRSLFNIPPEKLGTLGTIAKALTKAEYLPEYYEVRKGRVFRTYPSHILRAAFRAMEEARNHHTKPITQ